MAQEKVEGFRLSFEQERLWVLQGKNSVFSNLCEILIEGQLNKEALKKNLHLIVSRHEILRTTFQHLPGMQFPLQVIDEGNNFFYKEVDLSGHSTRRQDAVKQKSIRNERTFKYDVRRGSLLRCHLFIYSPLKYLLLINLPSVCADTVTLNNIFQEIVGVSSKANNEMKISKDYVQYVDYAEWQYQLRRSEECKLGNDFWKKVNTNNENMMNLPFQKKSSLDTTFQPKRLIYKANSKFKTRLEKYAQQHKTSIEIVLLACWHVLLRQLNGENSNFVVGTLCDGRSTRKLFRTLGQFSKYLPISGSMKKNSTFSEFLTEVQSFLNECQTWKEYYFHNYQFDKIELGGEEERYKYFPICFDYKKNPICHSNEKVKYSLLEHYGFDGQFDIKLSCHNGYDSLIIHFYYDSQKYLKDPIARLKSYFLILIQSIIEEPDKPVSEYSLLPQEEKKTLLLDFNNTKTDYPRDKTIHQLFEEQVEKTPKNTAVVFEGKTLTYEELNHKANQLAHTLREKGVTPDTLVGICVERSLEMIIGILGILKAGGAYLPIDPTYPRERIHFMLEDTRVSVLLSQSSLKDSLPKDSKTERLFLDTDWNQISKAPTENPVNQTHPNNLAYCIYTSGSTGVPKGSYIRHSSVCDLVHSLFDHVYYEYTSSKNVGLIASIVFDASVQQIFTSLIFGHTLHITPDEVKQDGDLLVKYFEEQHIEITDATPTTIDIALSSSALLTRDLDLKHLIIGGEALSTNKVANLTAGIKNSPVKITNVYGPTECCVDSTAYLANGDYKELPVIPIGKPIGNTSIYLLNSHLDPVPLGIPGELHIGGEGLARGYLNRPDLTAEKFIPNPFINNNSSKSDSVIGQRLYKTGDLARYLPDGNIEFLGRIDHQVKIRGFRIECGEIESVLREHSAVEETIVMAREDKEGGDKSLVAYLTSTHKEDSASTIPELRNYLKDKLPDYMIPAHFVFLDQLPLTPNGKIDRKALPEPDGTRPELEDEYVAPRTPEEETLCEIWKQVLNVDQVGIHDNFFELGGDSIKTIQIVSRAREKGIVFYVKTIFEHQTIAGLISNTEKSVLPEADQGIVTGYIPLTPIQHLFFEQNREEPAHHNQSVMLKLKNQVSASDMEKIIEVLLFHHDALRLRFKKSGKTWKQENVGYENIKRVFTYFDVSKLLRNQQKDFIEKKADEIQASLDLESGPIIRAALFGLGVNEPSRFFITIHHLAIDAVSWRILLEDLQTAYECLSHDKAVRLPFKLFDKPFPSFAGSKNVFLLEVLLN